MALELALSERRRASLRALARVRLCGADLSPFLALDREKLRSRGDHLVVELAKSEVLKDYRTVSVENPSLSVQLHALVESAQESAFCEVAYVVRLEIYRADDVLETHHEGDVLEIHHEGDVLGIHHEGYVLETISLVLVENLVFDWAISRFATLASADVVIAHALADAYALADCVFACDRVPYLAKPRHQVAASWDYAFAYVQVPYLGETSLRQILAPLALSVDCDAAYAQVPSLHQIRAFLALFVFLDCDAAYVRVSHLVTSLHQIGAFLALSVDCDAAYVQVPSLHQTRAFLALFAFLDCNAACVPVLHLATSLHQIRVFQALSVSLD